MISQKLLVARTCLHPYHEPLTYREAHGLRFEGRPVAIGEGRLELCGIHGSTAVLVHPAAPSGQFGVSGSKKNTICSVKEQHTNIFCPTQLQKFTCNYKIYSFRSPVDYTLEEKKITEMQVSINCLKSQVNKTRWPITGGAARDASVNFTSKLTLYIHNLANKKKHHNNSMYRQL